MPMPRFLARLLLLLSVMAGGATAAIAAEEILNFDSRIVVGADGVLDVTETIEVRAEGMEIRRGIYRDFPLTFEGEDGQVHRVSFDVVSVMRNGAPEPYHTNANSQGIRIYIGDANTFLPTGTYTYQLRYTTGRQVRFLPGHTELFWNVTGNDWSFPILAATARISLPEGRAPVRWTAYTGYYGDRGQDYAGQILGDNALEVETTRRLAPREGLSVVVEIPAGLVAPPTGRQAFWYWIEDNRRIVIAGLGFLGVLAFYLVTWHAVGRDPPRGTIIPLFHPPEGISPALAGYIDNWGWSEGGWRNFTAATLSLATKGLIVFDDSGKSIVLKRTEKPEPVGDEKLPPGEKVIFDWINRRNGTVTINKTSGASLASTFSTFKSKIEAENRDKFFKRNLGWFALGLGLTALAVAAVLFFGGLDESEIVLLIFCGAIGFVLGVFVVPVLRSLLSGRSGMAIIMAALQLVVAGYILVSFISVFASGMPALPTDFSQSALWGFVNNSFPFLLVGGFALLNGLFLYLLRAPTAAGRVVMDQIDGLELYIRTAESNRMNLAGAPDLTTTHFERLLPYAIALKAEKPWSEAFQAAFARANPTESFESGYRPGWHGGRGWHGSSFGASVASAVSAAAGSFQSSVPAPKSSSSGFSGGGGGGSGGGGGGGGGGGW
jgi:hypothetical protein